MSDLQQIACLLAGAIIGAAGTFALVLYCDWRYPRKTRS